MKAIDILREALKAQGYGGLMCDECSCDLENLCTHCYELNSAMRSDCVAGYKTPCDCDLNEHGIRCEFHIAADKPEPECSLCSDTGGTGLAYSPVCICPAGDAMRGGKPFVFPTDGIITACTCPAGQALKEGG